ncbi:putative iron-sulfur cluster-binding metallochaperone [Paraferrimonas sedimenticola]|uniref:putative iron-sulfur cluster-binding metallochaperone n=1 Tax=Paraferrimonas sedimenticola TaxID=375674 RepID=UPI00147272BC
MSNCCSNEPSTKAKCPGCRTSSKEVQSSTVKHHLKAPWKIKSWSTRLYFCKSKDCDVVYFSESGDSFRQSDVRTAVGQKDSSDLATVCYCYGVTRQEAISDDSAKSFVLSETKAKNCACEYKNPSGRCCLPDFPKN